ncbi:MAG: hypothetical protein HRT36_03585 [Alphaproteobacteria bacterium]|nr:hypothetical protein [Alphaproteobacteria bacterium]
MINKLFACFDRHLKDQGLLALSMDASIVVKAPRQRNRLARRLEKTNPQNAPER